MIKQFFIFILFPALCIFGAWSPAWSEAHSGTMTIEVDLSSQAKGQTARLWLPYPVSDRNQLISDMETTGDYSAIGVYTDRTYGTPILYAEWPKDAKTDAYRDYFWGNIDPYRVVVAHGRDVILNPPQKGAPLNTFGYPYAEVGGHPIDFYDPGSFVYRITYHEK